MFTPRSLVKIYYCVELRWPKGSVLALRPPGLEFRILCLEGSIISFIAPSSLSSPRPVWTSCAHMWPETPFISFYTEGVFEILGLRTEGQMLVTVLSLSECVNIWQVVPLSRASQLVVARADRGRGAFCLKREHYTTQYWSVGLLEPF